ncbi:SDR family oxidoreductase [Pseudomonas gessardii]|uniref:SDR family oxidoreductase n=1 Tax=Pseudomonas gessardii TaxID=78544 RepID=UPI0008909993|nr:SDR family oxidoreductase [Pseudomonas gessardii]MBH3421246.1 SDR family oxidoreductase [Pseudomonas gessardii]MRU49098.1 SDR family oxidoreductase [Pseudomonas gessardii]ONH49475.1 oxidoreductase [Pseudomonas gessardii]SDQ49291.1 Nucleoside-diphosphate-sugar epimerase [Pseudomonas gessardii]
MNYAFVTGATGLLGNNVVRALVNRKVKVKALVRSAEKARRQFGDLPVEFVVGDLLDVEAFSHHMQGCDALFHTAAYFRDNYKGGTHTKELHQINVVGTERLLQAAYAAGIRRAVHTSSIAVLKGNRDQLIDETMSRNEQDADNYYLSKIVSEQKIQAFLLQHPDMFIAMVLPGWMFGPGDLGPTSSGQFLLDFVGQRMPGIPPGTFSVVDARDVAEHLLAAMTQGRSGERYLAAGNHMDMKGIFQVLSQVSGIKAPEREVPLFMLRIIACAHEVYYRLTKKPVLISTSAVKLIAQEQGCTRFSHEKSLRDLGCQFRPVSETMADTLDWLRENNTKRA